MAKLEKEDFMALVDIALDAGDKKYFEELCDRQEKASFNEEVMEELDREDALLAVIERREMSLLISRLSMLFNNHTRHKDVLGITYDELLDAVYNEILASETRTNLSKEAVYRDYYGKEGKVYDPDSKKGGG